MQIMRKRGNKMFGMVKETFHFIIQATIVILNDKLKNMKCWLVVSYHLPMPKTLNLFMQHVLGNIPTDLCLIRNTPVSSKYGNMYSNSF